MANPFVIECRGCGCNDLRACAGGCSWVLLDIDGERGICSTCAETVFWMPWTLLLAGRPEPEITSGPMQMTWDALCYSSVGNEEDGNHESFSDA